MPYAPEGAAGVKENAFHISTLISSLKNNKLYIQRLQAGLVQWV
jgi:hypothetical protein